MHGEVEQDAQKGATTIIVQVQRGILFTARKRRQVSVKAETPGGGGVPILFWNGKKEPSKMETWEPDL